MKISRLADCGCNNCNCNKGTEKGNYTPGPAKGRLDTQLFPESHGTKYDRDVVRKTVNRRKKPKTAAREKTMVGVDVFKGQDTGINQLQWDQAYTEARAIYKEMKDAQAGDPNSVFWDTARLSADIKAQLVQNGIDEATADLAVESAISSDLRFRKTKRTANVQRYVIKVSQEKSEAGKIDDAIRNMDSIFGGDSTASSPEPTMEETPKPNVNPNEVTVIYPDFDAMGRKDTQEFKIPVPSEVSEKGTDEVLNYVWRQTNHVDGSEWIHDKPYRSSMVGDVYIINGENWVVMGVGFAKLPVDLEKWINTPDKWKYHSETDFAKLVSEAFSHAAIKLSCKECQLTKESALDDVDEHTKWIGKITSVAQAKKVCVEKNGRLPRVGYEMIIDTGEIEASNDFIDENGKLNKMHGHRMAPYKTYLQNNAGSFRVWTWVSV